MLAKLKPLLCIFVHIHLIPLYLHGNTVLLLVSRVEQRNINETGHR
jgi:hypothetical protein